MQASQFEAVIGLEVHAQLKTKTKIFCGCATNFEAGANENSCEVCAGYPGALPVLNRLVVEYAIRAGLALDCTIQSESIFARKNYFYPDLPKGYQISQFESPICLDGKLALSNTSIGIARIHIEEDAGKSSHGAGYSLVNLNRAGIPLIEIVSQPEIRSPSEASEYLKKLRSILMYIDVCDGNMEEGSFRCDANVSIRPRGESKLYTRTEIKNVNSFRFVEKAIEYEINRQIQVVCSGGAVVQETRLYDSGKNTTAPMRSKEHAHDYRYFPDPDLRVLRLDSGQIEQVRRSLPELPDARVARYVNALGLPAEDAHLLTSERVWSDFFESTILLVDEPKQVANWITGEMLRRINQDEVSENVKQQIPRTITSKNLAELICLISQGKISNTIAKQVFGEMYETGSSPEDIVRQKGLEQVSDVSAIDSIVDQVLRDNPSQVQEYQQGKEKLMGFFVGQVMKKMSGKSNPTVVGQLLQKRLKKET